MPIKLPSFRPRRDAYPPDLWTKCPSCGEMLFNKQLDKVLRVCPSCGHHFRLSAETRLEPARSTTARSSSATPACESEDPLGFVDQKAYPDRVAAAQLATGHARRRASGAPASIDGRPVAICVMDFGFMGGSMGAVVGEKVTRAAEHALAERCPLIIVSASGGARMQEGTLVADAAREDRRRARAAARRRRPVHQHPHATRRPAASSPRSPSLGDVNLAEPNALIGFAGARVSRRHDRPGAAAGLPAVRVPVRARLRRPGRPPRPSSATRSSALLRFLVARAVAGARRSRTPR